MERKRQFDRLGEIVSEKLEQIAADNGTLTRNSVKTILATEFKSFKISMEQWQIADSRHQMEIIAMTA